MGYPSQIEIRNNLGSISALNIYGEDLRWISYHWI